MTKSAVQIARDALAVGEAALPAYGSRYSRRDHTQPQPLALLTLRRFLRTDHRGVVTLVAEWRKLRDAPGLARVAPLRDAGARGPVPRPASKREHVPPRPGRADRARLRSGFGGGGARRGRGRDGARGPGT
jgi:hypothetical protein